MRADYQELRLRQARTIRDRWELYFSPGTEVLRNKLGLRDEAAFKIAEDGLTASRCRSAPKPGPQSLRCLQATASIANQNISTTAVDGRSFPREHRFSTLTVAPSGLPALIVYEATKSQFLTDNNDREIDEIILERYLSATGHRVAAAERRAWRESLGYMARVLSDQDIPDDSGVGVELHIPQSTKRIDVTLSGFDLDGCKHVVIVELKQWETATASAKDGIVVTYVGHAQREMVHPSYQAWSYAMLLEGFAEAVYRDGGIALHPCALLHNYSDDGVISAAHYADYIDKAPIFLKGEAERKRLRDHIKCYVRKGDQAELIHELANSRIRPSKALADGLAGLIKGNAEFTLIDDQKEVFEAALHAGRTASSIHPKVVLVEGGPGTGKTVVAINLLGRFITEARTARYVSKNAAPRKVYEKRLVGSIGLTRYSSLFSGSGAFVAAEPDDFDVLIVDEAHRLNEKSGLYGNLGEHQIKELISAAKCVVFFIDEDQRISFDDVGTKATIRGFAEARGAVVEEHALASQFRCSGSNGYIAWLDNTLDVRGTANTQLSTAEYDFQVFDAPDAMHDAIVQRNRHNKARVVAGYCWQWITRNRNPTGFDITIGDHYRRRWNLDKDGSLWIVTPGSIEEVGCIHTCQGLELEYVGVIVGPDLIVRDGKVRTVPRARARHDKTMKGYASLRRTDPAAADEIADRIIKNTYRTLMTRGMKGCCIYCTDPETAEYFRSRLARA